MEKRPFYAQTYDDFELSFAPLPSYLPCHIKLKSEKAVIVRPMTIDDVPKFYQAVQDAAREGKGYGSDEFESYEYFSRWYVHERHCITVQEADGDKRIIGFNAFGGSVYSRSFYHSCICESSIVILPEFRGSGIGSLMGNWVSALARECGFEGGFADSATTNLPNMLNNVNIGYVNTGVMPRGIRFEGKGWVSLLCFYRSLGSECDPILEDMKNNTIRAKL